MPLITDGTEIIDLTESEFGDIKDLLHLIRHKEAWAKRFLLEFGWNLRNDQISPEAIAASLVQGIWNCMQDGEKYFGFIIGNDEIDGNVKGYPDPMIELNKGDYVALMNLKEVRDANTWLASFIDVECKLFAEQKLRRTPRDVLRGLMNEVEQFDMNIETTEEMLEHFPELFAKQPAGTSTGKEEATK